MLILHISDLHYKNKYQHVESGYLSVFNSMTSPIIKLQKGLRKIASEQISLVLICGDLTEKGSIADYTQLKAYLDTMFGGIPYVVTLGNHDKKDNFCKAWKIDSEAHCTFGMVHEFEHINVIALDNHSLTKDNGEITAEHCSWLEKQFRLVKQNGRKTILMMHHPVIYDERTPIAIVDYSDEFTRIISAYEPCMMLCGHTHWGHTATFENVPYATSGSLSFRGIRLSDGSIRFSEDATMNLIRIEEDKINIREIDILEEKRVLGIIRME